jgi:hypothetical protein
MFFSNSKFKFEIMKNLKFHHYVIIVVSGLALIHAADRFIKQL